MLKMHKMQRMKMLSMRMLRMRMHRMIRVVNTMKTLIKKFVLQMYRGDLEVASGPVLRKTSRTVVCKSMMVEVEQSSLFNG